MAWSDLTLLEKSVLIGAAPWIMLGGFLWGLTMAFAWSFDWFTQTLHKARRKKEDQA